MSPSPQYIFIAWARPADASLMKDIKSRARGEQPRRDRPRCDWLRNCRSRAVGTLYTFGLAKDRKYHICGLCLDLVRAEHAVEERRA